MSGIATGESLVCVTTNDFLQPDDYESLLRTSLTPQSRFLLSWLADSKADCWKLIDWLSGRDFVTHRLENPALAILQSLPHLKEPLESVARETLVRRLSHAILGLSAAPEYLAKISIETWLEFFDLARRLGDGLLADSIATLHSSLITNEATFKSNREARRDFTDLVILYQTSNELESRWHNLIRGNDDPILYASLIDAMRGLLTMPVDISNLAFSSAVKGFCERLDRAKKDDAFKLGLFQQIESMISGRNSYKPFLELATAGLCNSFRWLPKAAENIRLIATTTDLAVLECWAWSLVSDHIESLARIRYQDVLQQSDISPPLKVRMLTGINNRNIVDTARPIYSSKSSTEDRVEAMNYYSELALAEAS